MAHTTTKSGYQTLVDRLNKFPLGVVESDTLYEILKTLVTEKEALMLSVLPLRPFTAAKAAKLWKLKINEARIILNDFCDKTMLVDIETTGEPEYIIPPPMAGFIEFSMMRMGNDRNQKHLERLDSKIRNIVEGRFGTGKRKYGLDRVYAKRPETTATVITLNLLVLNLEHLLRILYSLFSKFSLFRVYFTLYLTA